MKSSKRLIRVDGKVYEKTVPTGGKHMKIITKNRKKYDRKRTNRDDVDTGNPL